MNKPLSPPPTPVEEAIDTLHGVDVRDPFRWLEDGQSDQVRAWVDGQNAYTEQVLSAVPDRDRLRAKLEQALSTGTIRSPEVVGGRVFFVKREGVQNQPILYVRDTLDAPARVLIDPNTLRDDGTVALDWWHPSHDGALLAYGLSEAGDEKSTLRVLNVASGEHPPDTIPHTRYSAVAWLADGSGFFYSRYPAPGAVPEGEDNYNQRIFFHRLGDPWQDDRLVFGDGRAPETMYGLDISPDGRWLVITAAIGWAKTDLYLLDTSSEGRIATIVEGIDAIFHAQVFDDHIYILTNHDAPRYQTFKTAVDRPEREHWQIIIAEGEHTLESLRLIGGKLVLKYLRNAASHLVVTSTSGSIERTVDLPTLGSVDQIAGEHSTTTALFTFQSFFVPPTLYRYDVATEQLTIYDQIESPIDTAAYEVEQIWYPSKDGTPISMFLAHRRGIERTGDHPAVLYGYGGFNVNLTPSFWSTVLVWLEQGGIFAVPNLRGGGEYGEEWHQAGMLGKKQHVFDDFIAAAEWLIANSYTSSERLAIMGGSNGGLLVGAALTQRPDLFAAVVCQVPLLDMLRYHHFLIARLWIPEYGSADDPDQFGWLHAYSPYHNVAPGTEYPAVLFTTADSDSRVDPLHARKMAALLQAANRGDNPILLRVETRAGHGAGKPLAKQIDEATDVWSFIGWRLGLTERA